MGRQQYSEPPPARAKAQQCLTSEVSPRTGPAVTPLVPDPELVSRLLAENVDDCMSLGFFSHLISITVGAGAGDVRSQCMGYLDHMLSEGYMGVGTVLENTFLPWVVGAAQTREAISRQWPEADVSHYESLRDIAWLLNTSKGNDAGRDYRESHGWPACRHLTAEDAERRIATEGPRAPHPSTMTKDNPAKRPCRDESPGHGTAP